ncbi:calcium-binding protein [Shimia sp. FJ5]|uniref:calcium-binding protein n=1 Tax=Shimia sp. FJ5 TaxID=3079054 RepID=UPI002611593C|nr:calcium-binding protein [Shimia sp. FJ5]MDV4144710.1 calcium-binding protein [Shimia sp. FJ5]
MTKLQIVQGVDTPDESLSADIRDLHVVQTENGPMVISTTGINGGLVSYSLETGQGAQTLETTAFLPDGALNLTGEISILSQDGQDILVIGSNAEGSFGYVMNSDGTFGDLIEIPGLGSNGEVSALHDSTTGFVFMAEHGSDGIGVYSQTGPGQFAKTATLQDTDDSHLTDVVCLAGETTAAGRIVLAASRGEGGITSYCLDTETGEVKLLDSLGVEDGLGLLPEIVGLETLSAYGNTFAITASSAPEFGAGAISVMRIGADGSLIATDHLLDTLSTRFGQVQSLTTVNAGDRTYILAGGGDDGLTLFMLLPNGRLLHLDSFAHSEDAPLENLSALVATQVGDEVQVLAATSTTPGLTQFSFSVVDQGLTLQGGTLDAELAGSGDDDLISGGSGNDAIFGYDGHDTLVDGAGQDTLNGGGGYDIFVLDEDGAVDVIVDFDKSKDRIDLSAFSMLYDPYALDIESTATGALIHWRGETTEIIRKGSGSLSRSEIIQTIITGPDRPPMVVDREWIGTGANDILSGLWGNDTLDGLDGRDHLMGDVGNDHLSGGAGADTLIGGAGNDTLIGGNGQDRAFMGDGDDLFIDSTQAKIHGQDYVEAGAGDDTIEGGGGKDTFFGDAGNDLLKGGGGGDTIYGGSGMDVLRGAKGRDHLYGGDDNDLLFGNKGGDKIFGGNGDDMLRGDQGKDRLFGASGNDTVEGGIGRDTAKLGDGDDLWIDDIQTGFKGSDTVDGGDGNDTIESRGGGDVLSGGSGADEFVFLGESGRREITDFDPSEDLLRIEISDRPMSDFVLSETPEGLLLSWTGGRVTLTGLSEDDFALSDVLFDLG